VGKRATTGRLQLAVELRGGLGYEAEEVYHAAELDTTDKRGAVEIRIEPPPWI
jgi:hypothetical protein